jgi:pyruvate/2-oxoglutarate dehydrogenase complex dihydrolipoamide dehydrogenase (E3) component
MLAQAPQTVDDRVIPWWTFTDPELDRTIINDQTFGSVKLLADLDGKILGGHILGANAGDLITPVVYAIRYGLTIKMIAEAMLPYPTMAEAVRWTAAHL